MSAPLLSRARIRAGGWLAGALVAVTAVPLVVTTPGWTQEVEPPAEELPAVDCPEFAGEPAAEDEITAYQYALACDVDVEVTSLRDIDREVYATPAGLLDARVAVQPYQVRDGAGQWVPIDPSLVSQPDGSAIAAAVVIEVAVGAGGDAPFVTATDPDGGSLSMSWPGGGLPAPVLDGPVATYPEVLPGVDLAVQAEPVGFSWVLVVKTPEAAADPALSQISFEMDAAGLSVVETDRGIAVTNEAGDVVFESGQAIMWDSSPDEQSPARVGFLIQSTPELQPASPRDPQIGDVDMTLTGSEMTLAPDPEMLTDENLTFPIYIDPPFTSSRRAWANVYDGDKGRGWTGDSSWPRSGGMRVGKNTWPDCGNGCGVWRSVIRVNIGTLKGRYIHSANVRALQTHTGGCGSYGLQLWRTQAISNSVSWNGITWLYGSPLQTKSVPSSNQYNCGSGKKNEWVSFTGSAVKTRVQSAADSGNETITFGFRSSSEGSRDAWRRIRTGEVALHVTYYIYPPKPDLRKLNGEACQTNRANADWVTSNRPTLSVRAKSYESESVYVRLRVRKQGADSNYWFYRTPDPVGSYSIVNRTVTTSLPDGEYNWQARTDSRHTEAVNSGYTNLCYFKVDATKPTTPTVSGPDGGLVAGQDVTLDISSTDPVVNGVRSGLHRYEYSWGSPTYDNTLVADGDVQVTTRSVLAGRHVLYVRSVDHAGNVSNERTHTFFVGRNIPATPMGIWRFEGDEFDDTGHGHDLTLTGGGTPALGTDREGRSDAALELDGGSCLTGPAPVRTDAAFTVALWVRMDTAPADYAKVLSQGNTVRSAYQVQYSTADGKWYFSLLTAGEGDFTWRSIGAPNPAGLGEWLHIAGTYDPDAGLQRIYFNGDLAAEQAIDFEPWDGRDTFGVGCLRSVSGSTSNHFTGAVDGLGAWQGLLSRSQIQDAMTDLPGAAELARWEFRNWGEDTSRYDRDIEIPAHIEAGPDAFNRPKGALNLDGETCLEYSDPVLRTDRSFSVAAWVKWDASGGVLVSTSNRAVSSGVELGARQMGPTNFVYYASYHYGGGSKAVVNSRGIDLSERGSWHHVAFSYDHISGERKIYVDGELHTTHSASPRPVPSTAQLRIGCTDVSNSFNGSLQDVRLWRGVVDGVDLAAVMGSPPPELAAHWLLQMDIGEQKDSSGNGHDLTFEGHTEIWDGYSCDPDSALELTGSGSAATAGPVVATDESFTVTAWGRIDSLTNNVTFLSAAGQQQTGFRLQYEATQQQFQFVMTSGDVPSGTGGFTRAIARGGPTPEVDTWYHLAGAFNLGTGEITLYVTGEPVATAAGPGSPWYADGPLVLGASATADGERWDLLRGAVDDVVVWRGVVPDHVLDQMSPATPIEMC